MQHTITIEDLRKGHSSLRCRRRSVGSSQAHREGRRWCVPARAWRCWPQAFLCQQRTHDSVRSVPATHGHHVTCFQERAPPRVTFTSVITTKPGAAKTQYTHQTLHSRLGGAPQAFSSGEIAQFRRRQSVGARRLGHTLHARPPLSLRGSIA